MRLAVIAISTFVILLARSGIFKIVATTNLCDLQIERVQEMVARAAHGGYVESCSLA